MPPIKRRPPPPPEDDEPPADIDRFDEAVESWRARVPMLEGEWEQLQEQEREHAFKVAEVSRLQVVTEVWYALDRAVANGTTFSDFKAEVGEQLEAAWGREDGWRLETVFRTNVLSAYSAGRHAVLTAPAVKRARPYWRFDSADDSRVSDVCEALEGTILAADDPFWRTHTPPLHHNCRSHLVPLDPEEAAEEGGASEAPDVEASEGFGRPPSRAGHDWKPDPDAYPEPLGDVLRERLDDAE